MILLIAVMDSMKPKLKTLLGVACVCCLVSTGCTLLLLGGAAAAGAGTVVYVRGELQTTVDATLDGAWRASRDALKDLQMPVTAETKDGLTGKLTARTAGDKKVTIRLKKVTDTTTDLSIRMGTWGDETASRQLLEQIKKRL